MIQSEKERENMKTQSGGVEVVTPEIAMSMETEGNYRALQTSRVALYADKMKAGEWMVGQPIIIDINGKVIDGQHRIAAVVKSGVSTEFFVIRGANPGASIVCDIGSTRTARDVFKFMHGRNSNRHPSIIRIYMFAPFSPRLAVDAHRLLKCYEANIEDLEWLLGDPTVNTKGVKAEFCAALCRAHSYGYPEDSLRDLFSRHRDGVTGGEVGPLSCYASYVANRASSCGVTTYSEGYLKASRAIKAYLDREPMKILKVGPDPFPFKGVKA